MHDQHAGADRVSICHDGLNESANAAAPSVYSAMLRVQVMLTDYLIRREDAQTRCSERTGQQQQGKLDNSSRFNTP